MRSRSLAGLACHALLTVSLAAAGSVPSPAAGGAPLYGLAVTGSEERDGHVSEPGEW